MSQGYPSPLTCKMAQQFQEAIQHYSGNDPLAPWISYLDWLQGKYCRSSEGMSEGVLEVLARCLETFQDDPRYKNREEYLKLWMLYADSTSEYEKVFAILQEKGIAQTLFLFYQAQILILEGEGNFAAADKIFMQAILANVEPRAGVLEQYQQFKQRWTENMRAPMPTPTARARSPIPAAPVFSTPIVSAAHPSTVAAPPVVAPVVSSNANSSTVPAPKALSVPSAQGDDQQAGGEYKKGYNDAVLSHPVTKEELSFEEFRWMQRASRYPELDTTIQVEVAAPAPTTATANVPLAETKAAPSVVTKLHEEVLDKENAAPRRFGKELTREPLKDALKDSVKGLNVKEALKPLASNTVNNSTVGTTITVSNVAIPEPMMDINERDLQGKPAGNALLGVFANHSSLQLPTLPNVSSPVDYLRASPEPTQTHTVIFEKGESTQCMQAFLSSPFDQGTRPDTRRAMSAIATPTANTKVALETVMSFFQDPPSAASNSSSSHGHGSRGMVDPFTADVRVAAQKSMFSTFSLTDELEQRQSGFSVFVEEDLTQPFQLPQHQQALQPSMPSSQQSQNQSQNQSQSQGGGANTGSLSLQSLSQSQAQAFPPRTPAGGDSDEHTAKRKAVEATVVSVGVNVISGASKLPISAVDREFLSPIMEASQENSMYSSPLGGSSGDSSLVESGAVFDLSPTYCASLLSAWNTLNLPGVVSSSPRGSPPFALDALLSGRETEVEVGSHCFFIDTVVPSTRKDEREMMVSELGENETYALKVREVQEEGEVRSLWEFAMGSLVRTRLREKEKEKESVLFHVPVEAHLFAQHSVLLAPHHGITLQSVISSLASAGGRVEEPLALFLGAELLRVVSVLQQCELSHVALHPASFYLRTHDGSLDETWTTERKGSWAHWGVTLGCLDKAVDLRTLSSPSQPTTLAAHAVRSVASIVQSLINVCSPTTRTIPSGWNNTLWNSILALSERPTSLHQVLAAIEAHLMFLERSNGGARSLKTLLSKLTLLLQEHPAQ